MRLLRWRPSPQTLPKGQAFSVVSARLRRTPLNRWSLLTRQRWRLVRELSTFRSLPKTEIPTLPGFRVQPRTRLNSPLSQARSRYPTPRLKSPPTGQLSSLQIAKLLTFPMRYRASRTTTPQVNRRARLAKNSRLMLMESLKLRSGSTRVLFQPRPVNSRPIRVKSRSTPVKRRRIRVDVHAEMHA